MDDRGVVAPVLLGAEGATNPSGGVACGSEEGKGGAQPLDKLPGSHQLKSAGTAYAIRGSKMALPAKIFSGSKSAIQSSELA